MEVANIFLEKPANLKNTQSLSMSKTISVGTDSPDDLQSCPTDKPSYEAIHVRAVEAARNLKKSEIELIEALKAVDAHKVYRKCGATSLFQYAVHILDLTESRAYDYITVMRKARENHRLDRALHAGLSITKARRIASRLVEANSDELISWAKTKSLRDLDNTLAVHFPDDYRQPERVRFQSSSLARLEANIDLDCEQLIRRVQDLECQRLRRPVTLGEVLKVLAREYLEKKDPVKKAERWARKGRSLTGVEPMPALETAPKNLDGPTSGKSASNKGLSANGAHTALSAGQAAGDGPTAQSAGNANEPRPPKQHRRVLSSSHKQAVADLKLSENKNHLVQTRFAPAAPPWAIRRKPLRAATTHEIYKRDKGQCQAQDPITEQKCKSSRWVDIHHVMPKSRGGADSAENLMTICSAHHRMIHSGNLV